MEIFIELYCCIVQNQCEGWHVECEGPNSRLYEFTGNVHV